MAEVDGVADVMVVEEVEEQVVEVVDMEEVVSLEH